MKTSVVVYVNTVVVAALASLVGLYIADPIVDSGLAVGAIALTSVGFLGAAFSYRIQGNTYGEVSFIPYLSAIVIYPSWLTLSLVGLGTLTAELLKPKPNIKRAFNVSQAVLAGAAATVAYVSLGGESLIHDPTFRVVPHVIGVIVFLLINTFAVAVVIGLAEGKGIFQTWYTGNTAGLVYDVVAIPAVYAFARAYVDWRLGGVVFLCALVYGLRLAYRSKHQLETTNRELLELIVQTVEYHDMYTSGHSQRVRRYSRIIADLIGLPQKDIDRISIAALLHDVGKIHAVFSPILMKPGRLTPEERALMQLHPIKSAELVGKISDLQDIVPAVRHHHENWDGSGYPDGLRGRDIPLASRIIIFADTIDAMTTDRPYRKALGEVEVRAEISKYRGRQFDPDICDLLLASPSFSRLFNNDVGDRSRSLTQILDRVRKRVVTPVPARASS